MGVEEVSAPEEIDQGDPGEIGKHLRQHSDSEEKTWEDFVLLFFFFLKLNLTCSQQIVLDPHF